MSKSMLDLALEIMNEKKTVAFSSLWSQIAKKLNLSEEDKAKKIANFYSQLTLDGRIVALGNNKFTLRDRIASNKLTDDLSAVYNDMELESEDSDEEEESEEKKESTTNNAEEAAI